MGCCGSKQTEHEQDEQEHLITDSTQTHRYGTHTLVAPTFGQSQVRELESLQKIVERTAGNLIDIPSTLQVERIQQQDAQIRSNEYTIALSTVKLPQQTIRKLTNMTNFKAAGADPPGVNDVLETDVGARTGNAPINGRVRSSTSSGSSIKAPSVREVLAEKTVDPKTVGWMASVVGELQQATESIDVEDVGDLIATLSPPVIRV